MGTELVPVTVDLRGNKWTLYQGDSEPYIRDIDWAQRLGFDRPRDIRKLIKRMCDAGRLGMVVCATVAQTGELGGRPATEFYLTRGQALKVAAKSETEFADDLLDQMIQVFLLAVHPAPRALPVQCEPLLFALQHPGHPRGCLLTSPALAPGHMDLTNDPGGFWTPGTTIWVAEAGEVISRTDGTLVAAGVRVLREATKADLATAGVYFDGTHKVSGDGFPRSYTQLRQVYAFGDAKILSHGLSTSVRAWERSVITSKSSTVIAGDNVRVKASGVARIFAFGSAVVDAEDDAVVHASQSAMVRARGRVVVRAVDAGVTTMLSEQAVRIEYDKKKLSLPRASMAAQAQLGA